MDPKAIVSPSIIIFKQTMIRTVKIKKNDGKGKTLQFKFVFVESGNNMIRQVFKIIFNS